MEQNYTRSFINHNNFIKNADIVSNLIYGNENITNKPFITIAIPTYKRERLLELAVDSVISQLEATCNYEIIIVDNEESNTETKTEKFIKSINNEKILYYRNIKNIGMVANWNRCIELSRGEWIAFLHDDDLLDSYYMKNVLKLLDRKKYIGGIISNNIVIRNDLSTSQQSPKPYKLLGAILKKINSNKLMRLYPIDSQIYGNIYGAPTCGNIFRKKYLIELGGFDDKHYPSADWVFIYNFSKKYKVYKTSAQFGYYRIFENESLNPETIKGFILHAIDFRQHLKETTMFGKIIEFLFRDERYFQSLTWSGTLTQNLEQEFGILSKKMGYKFRSIRYMIFKLIQFLYWKIKILATIILG